MRIVVGIFSRVCCTVILVVSGARLINSWMSVLARVVSVLIKVSSSFLGLFAALGRMGNRFGKVLLFLRFGELRSNHRSGGNPHDVPLSQT